MAARSGGDPCLHVSIAGASLGIVVAMLLRMRDANLDAWQNVFIIGRRRSNGVLSLAAPMKRARLARMRRTRASHGAS